MKIRQGRAKGLFGEKGAEGRLGGEDENHPKIKTESFKYVKSIV